ncbi:MAG: hypothetical protein MUP47_00305 [Phycisphaerae bacterium]|nr:hypothetical protein [Phycisphaerae bacterium]
MARKADRGFLARVAKVLPGLTATAGGASASVYPLGWHVVGALVLCTVLSWPTRAAGILVRSERVSCPICGQEVTLERWISFGSYMFDWPDKYDLVYRPQTREGFIACCARCGYAQTAPEFLEISAEQVARLKAAEFMRQWQPSDPNTKVPFLTRLERVIKTNEILGGDPGFWAWFNRIVIYHYRSLDPAKARQVAEQEIAILKKGTEESDKLLKKQRLYLLGEYSRLIGDSKGARRYFDKARRTSINYEITKAPILAGGLCLGLGVLLTLPFLKRLRVVLVILLVAVLLSVTVAVVSWHHLRDLRQPDDYYNSLIDDRVKLLDSASQPADRPRSQARRRW